MLIHVSRHQIILALHNSRYFNYNSILVLDSLDFVGVPLPAPVTLAALLRALEALGVDALAFRPPLGVLALLLLPLSARLRRLLLPLKHVTGCSINIVSLHVQFLHVRTKGSLVYTLPRCTSYMYCETATYHVHTKPVNSHETLLEKAPKPVVSCRHRRERTHVH